MSHDDRDTLPPPPHDDWRQELTSALAAVQDEVGEMMHLFGRMYTRASTLGGALVRLGEAISRVPPP